MVSVFLSPSLLLQCLIRLSFSVPSSLSSLRCGTPSLFGLNLHLTLFGFYVYSSVPLFSFIVYQSIPVSLTSLPLPSWFCVCAPCVTTLLCICGCVYVRVFVCACVCVFSVLIQQRRKGRQRGSNLSVCTLSSLSRLSLSLFLFFLSLSLSHTLETFFPSLVSMLFLYHGRGFFKMY